jgi:hypothetical protein
MYLAVYPYVKSLSITTLFIQAMERSPMGQPPPHLLKPFSCMILWNFFPIFWSCCLAILFTHLFCGIDNQLITFISARLLAMPDQQESDTTGGAECVKQHHTHHLCDLQMTSAVP